MPFFSRELLWTAMRGVGAATLFRRLHRNKILIVMYHAVVDGKHDYQQWTHLPVHKFAWQVAYLKKHFSLLPLSALLQRNREGAVLPPNPAVITFDDGFQNVYSNAFPILRALRTPATVFLVTGHVETDTPCWPEQLFLALRATPAQELNLEEYGLGRYALGSLPARDAACDRLRARLKCMETVEKNRIMSAIMRELEGWSGTPPEFADDFRLLAWREIEEMHASGLIEFGGHTVNHDILSRMPQSEQRREILQSLATVRERLGLKHMTFAYPNGQPADFTNDTKKILREEGALCGLSTIEGLCDPADDPYELKRIGVGCDMTPQRFALLCSGFLPWLKASLSSGERAD